MALVLPSPAKINWYLHITGKRSDGYHNLQTCFQFIDLQDTFTFEALKTPDIQITGMDIPLENNLIFKACKVMQSFAPNKGVAIKVSKQIPMGGGLGGGSSNAATTLVALNQLWNIHLPQDKLIEIGAKLGADVPVFIFGRGCVAQGIGEQMFALDMPSRWLLLIIPDCQISTKILFNHPELTRNSPSFRIETLEAPVSVNLRPQGFKNDFEPLVRKLYTPVAQAMDWLEAYSSANLSGSGSCVFAAFEDEQSARKVAEKLPKTMKGLVVKSLNTSPLFDRAKKSVIIETK